MTVEIKPNVFWIGVNDRTTDLFEGMWPIADGVSYNSYLIKDKKPVLIDLAKSTHGDAFIEQIEEIMPLSDLNKGYLVLNHLEPDHTGILKSIRRNLPDIQIVATRKALTMTKAFYGIDEGFLEVDDGSTLDTGDRTLSFYKTPFVHWPETMMTFDPTSKILFACDGFGGYGALRGAIFDDEIADLDFYRRESLRYYANIVAKFSNSVLKAINKLIKANVPIEVIAPSHGIIWRKNPSEIIQLYQKWAGYAQGPREKAVTLVYGSMYGNTEKMMNNVAQGISSIGVPVEIFDAGRVHVSYILSALWKNEGVIIGAPTYETEMFPPVAHVLDIARRKRIIYRTAALFGSYAWSGGTKREWTKFVEQLKWRVIEEFEFHGGPTKEDLQKGLEFGKKFGEVIKSK